MRIIQKNSQGFTLIEILITIIIASIVFGVAFSLQFFGLRTFSMGSSQAEVQQSARIVEEVLRKELRNAVYIGDTQIYFVGEEEKTAPNYLSFSGQTLSFGENGSSKLFIEGIQSISISNKDQKTLSIVITGTGNSFELSNEIFLNNTSISNDFNLDLDSETLYYSYPPED